MKFFGFYNTSKKSLIEVEGGSELDSSKKEPEIIQTILARTESSMKSAKTEQQGIRFSGGDSVKFFCFDNLAYGVGSGVTKNTSNHNCTESSSF